MKATKAVEFEKYPDVLDVLLNNEKSVKIPLADYRDWLKRNFCLDWEVTYAGASGDQQIVTGEMSLSEYFENDIRDILVDINTYLESKGVMKQFDVVINRLKKAI